MQVIKILIFEAVIVCSTKLAVVAGFLLLLRPLYFAHFIIDVLLHSHQNHWVQFLKVLHHCLLAVYWSKVGSNVVCPIFFSESDLFVGKNINQKIDNLWSVCDYYSSKSQLFQYLQFLYLFGKRIALKCIQQLPYKRFVVEPIKEKVTILKTKLKKVLIFLRMDMFYYIMQDPVIDTGQIVVFWVWVIFVKENENFDGRYFQVRI